MANNKKNKKKKKEKKGLFGTIWRRIVEINRNDSCTIGLPRENGK